MDQKTKDDFYKTFGHFTVNQHDKSFGDEHILRWIEKIYLEKNEALLDPQN